MSLLLENFQQITTQIENFNTELAKSQQRIDAINAMYSEDIPARIENLKAQLVKIDEYRLKVEGFKKLAQDNLTSMNLPTIEAPEGYRINLNRLRKWAMMIAPYTPDDPYAKRVYLVACCDLNFLDQKDREFRERINELENDQSVGAYDLLKKEEQARQEILERYKQFVTGSEMSLFASLVKDANDAYYYTEAPARYPDVSREPDVWVPGAIGFKLGLAEEFKDITARIFGTYYDTKRDEILIPLEDIPTDREFAITVSCIPARSKMNLMDAGIRNLAFRMLDRSPACSRRVILLDGLRLNSVLAGGLKALEGSYCLSELPRNSEQIEAQLEELMSSFNDIDEALEDCDSVIEYNRINSEGKQLPRTLVVAVGWPEAFTGKAGEYMKRIVTNYERYGVSFIIARIAAKFERNFGLSEYTGENAVYIEMTGSETTITRGSVEPSSFRWYGFKHVLGEEYVKALRAQKSGNNGLGNIYTERVNLEDLPKYARGNKSVSVPCGVNSKDELKSIEFNNENFAAYLMGASGSGKSTLLHTIITGIIAKYHPDDVELWLADFKMSEFSQYINPMPPHIKYILLDESSELVFDLIDKLTEKMMERQRYFMKNRNVKNVGDVSSKVYMPVIFVILDEFSIMSQAVSENESYKLKLQNLLAKGRALGIKFIFASQTYSKGVLGLTGTAKEQIQLRLAMKNSSDEVALTLDLASSAKTDQVKSWMEALPPHYVLSKYREGEEIKVERLKVLYFPGRESEAMAPQRRLIEKIQSGLHKVSIKEYNPDDPSSYVDKEPVVVDGNSYMAFKKQQTVENLEAYRKENADRISSEDRILLPGVPRRMSNLKAFTLSQESRENVLMIARSAETAPAMSVVASLMKEYAAQGGKVRVWAYQKNRLYMSYRDEFNNYSVFEGISDVCAAISNLCDRIAAKRSGDELIIMLGMEQLCGDFGLMDRKNAPTVSDECLELLAQVNSGTTGNGKPGRTGEETGKADKAGAETGKKHNKQEEIKVKPAAAVNNQQGRNSSALLSVEGIMALTNTFWGRDAAKSEDEEETENQEVQDTDNVVYEDHYEEFEEECNIDELTDRRIDEGWTTDEISEEYNKLYEQFCREKGYLNGTEGREEDAEEANEEGTEEAVEESPEENSAESDEEENDIYADYSYAAGSDLIYLIKQGSRFGYHFAAVLNNVSDIKATGFSSEFFRHKLAFTLGPEDSSILFGSKIASKLPDRICEYSDGLEHFSFRPFIHENINWDGWQLNENGDAESM